MRAIFSIDGTEYRVFAQREADAYRVHVDDCSYRITNDHDAIVAVDGDTIHVWLDGEAQTFRYHEPVAYYGSHADGSTDDTILAPMPGTVVTVMVKAGEAVARGDTLLVIESMKLETSVKAPRDGRIDTVHVAMGQSFDRSAPLATLATLATVEA
ncbi:acetyl-CoA carboxylase biotin carboxyl carrier protein subunit [Bradyrhizobium sp. LHD-71]|uniref:acetyl-CoA carboxylase biotin carboxyl carrier protein subunit n=1 Tax=Bradyrhizobium sp. LHD-71 TaxID=3072141 RepID=UPI00280CD781|nr:acetyl-CoA carboxylase biotin carboxyl carrier protein subunit [Bradyrhizobium sp. LHD-71]MDQ8727479.1 acetyl-CoA carboxylase biotin carboxyl carrier protein subunit [Bradyrhizobium sp. LHD-71]